MATLSEAEYKAIAGRAYEAFKRYPNVHSVGIGGRERNGRPTGEIVIKVFVSRKLAPSALATEDVIPAEFEGLKTDIVQTAPPVNQQNLLDRVPGFRSSGDVDADGKLKDDFDEDTAKVRPLKGGIQIEGGHREGFGTLGFFLKVQAPDTRVMAVTNYHVLFSAAHGPVADLRVGNPNPDESCTACCVGAFGRYVQGFYNATVDVTISRLDPDTEWLAEIQCIGYIRGHHPLTVLETANLDYNIRKYGRTTRLTGGTVHGLNVHGSSGSPGGSSRSYTNAIVVKPNPSPDGGVTLFTASGDSGSAYVNDANEIVGLHFGGESRKAQPDVGWGYGIPIADVVAAFAPAIVLIPATATRLGDVQRTPTAAGAEAAVAAAREAQLLGERLERELSHSARGRLMTQLWLRHSSELNGLVNRNRKVGALWRRHGGAALFQHAIRAARLPDTEIPATIDGRPVDDCVDKIIEVFAAYGSDALRADIAEHRTCVPPLAGRTYSDILATLD